MTRKIIQHAIRRCNYAGRSEWHDRRDNTARHAEAICEAYTTGLSAAQVAERFAVSIRTVLNILRRCNIPRRSRSEGCALRWTESDFRSNQVAKRKGRPPSNLGTTWTMGCPVAKPNLRGEKNPNWKGGRLSLQLLIRRSGAYQFWRRAVFTRDGYACVRCHASGVRFAADHIYPFAKILDDFALTTVEAALQCAALWDVSNGRTLCVPCHRDTPTFGANGRRRAD